MNEEHKPASSSPEADRPEPLPRSKRKFRIVVVGALALAAAAAAGRHVLRSTAYVSTDDAYIEGRVIPISPRVAGHVLKVWVEDNQMTTSGTLLVEIDPRDYEARLEQKKAAFQAAVASADMARIGVGVVRTTSSGGLDEASSGLDQTRFGVDTARSALEAARKMEAQAKAQLEAAEAAAQRFKAEADAAQAEAERAAKDSERYAKLAGEKVVSDQEYDLARAAAKAAQALLEAARQQAEENEAGARKAQMAHQTAADQVDQAEAQLNQAGARVGEAQGRFTAAGAAPDQVAASQAQFEMAAAQVELARAAVRQAELELSYTRMEAPQDGWVTRKSVEAGAFVQVGQPLMAIVTPEVWVLANFKETQLSRMRPGQSGWIEVDAYPGRRFRGRVDSIQSGTGARFSLLPPENATGNFVKVVQRVPVKIVFDEPAEPGRRLVPGMSVVFRVKVR